MALSFEADIKPMLEAAGGACMLNAPPMPGGAETHPCAAFDIFNHVEVIKKSNMMLVEFVLGKMPPPQSVPDFDYAAAATKFAQWIDDGMLP